MPVTVEAHRKLLAELVGSGKISNSSQLDLVVDYLKKSVATGGEIDFNDFNEKCGVGKNFTAEQIFEVVNSVFEANKVKLEEGIKKTVILDEIKKQIPYV